VQASLKTWTSGVVVLSKGLTLGRLVAVVVIVILLLTQVH
jgi:hypothetical protein